MKKFVLSVLILVMIFCFGIFTACNKKPEEPDNNQFTATGEYIIEKGYSEYRLVYPKDIRYYEQLAVNDFTNLFLEATGVKLQSISDDAITSLDKNSKYIFIGGTKQAEEKNIFAPDSIYTFSGYILKTIDNSVYIVGGSDRGTLFGAYKLLEYILDYDFFYEGVYSLNKNVSDIELMNYDLEVIPDIEYVTVSNSATQGDNEERYLMNGMNDYKSLTGHRSMYYVPVEKYLLVDESSPDYHPMWYMTNSENEFPRLEDGSINFNTTGGVTQLCYTAHGIESEFNALALAVAQRWIDAMKENQDLYQFMFGMSDDHNWCECSACAELMNKYGTPASSVIIFLNKATSLVDEWFKTEEGRPYKRRFDVYFYAYFELEVAPVYFDDDTDKYVAIDDKTVCNSHVVPRVAIMQSDMSASIHADVNRYTKDMYQRWMAVSNRLASYVYIAKYCDYMSPYNTINDMQAMFKFLKECNVVFSSSLGTGSEVSGYPTGWATLKVYLAGKLGVDVNADVNYYINRYFDKVYGVASDTMKKFFDEYRALDEYNAATYSSYAGLNAYYPHNKDEKYFSRFILERWRGYVNKALEEIEYMKEFDQRRYEATKMMVLGERLWLDYFYYYIYNLEFTEEELSIVKKELADLIVYTKTTLLHEGPPVTSIDGLLAELRK